MTGLLCSPVPIKPPEFAVTKSVNYLQNAMVGLPGGSPGGSYEGLPQGDENLH